MKRRDRLVIGLTGGIATGKSTVLAELARQGAHTISSDALAHQALRRGTQTYRAIVRYFGPGILTSDKQVDRHALGHVVFQDAVSRRWLEKQIHPVVIRKLRAFMTRHKGLLVLDIPLLYETRLERLVDRVVVVSASRQNQIARLLKRNGLARKEALKRIRAQMPLSEKARRADHVLTNSGDFTALRKKTSGLLQRLVP